MRVDRVGHPASVGEASETALTGWVGPGTPPSGSSQPMRYGRAFGAERSDGADHLKSRSGRIVKPTGKEPVGGVLFRGFSTGPCQSLAVGACVQVMSIHRSDGHCRLSWWCEELFRWRGVYR